MFFFLLFRHYALLKNIYIISFTSPHSPTNGKFLTFEPITLVPIQGCIKLPTTWYSPPPPFLNLYFLPKMFNTLSILFHFIFFSTAMILQRRWYCFPFPLFQVIFFTKVLIFPFPLHTWYFYPTDLIKERLREQGTLYTPVPIQTKLILPELLDKKEVEWLNNYHQTCRDRYVGEALITDRWFFCNIKRSSGNKIDIWCFYN